MWRWKVGQKDETEKSRRFAEGGQCVEVTAVWEFTDSLVKWVRWNSYQHHYAQFAATPRPHLLSKLIAFITHPGIGHEVLRSSWPTLYVNFSSTLCIQTPNLPVPWLLNLFRPSVLPAETRAITFSFPSSRLSSPLTSYPTPLLYSPQPLEPFTSTLADFYISLLFFSPGIPLLLLGKVNLLPHFQSCSSMCPAPHQTVCSSKKDRMLTSVSPMSSIQDQLWNL